MKKLYFICLLSLLFLEASAQNAFITKWNVPSDNFNLVINTDSSYSYDYTIDFGDGHVTEHVTGNATHTYTNAGTYTVSITGTFPSIKVGYNIAGTNMADLINSIEQWGDIEWSSMKFAFYRCKNLVVNATDVPDLSNVTSLSYMFANTTNIGNPDFNNWDTSNITSMEYMFYKSNFNGNVENWDISNVKTTYYMFFQNYQFNKPLNNWNTTNITNTKAMFCNALSFNQPLNNWDVSSVTDMSKMFQGATNFNGDISTWNMSNVKNTSNMFRLASAFNQNIESWDVSNVINMTRMFEGATNFNQPLDNWDVSKVAFTKFMFKNATAFNQPLNSWDTSKVRQVIEMFHGATSFNQPLDNWDVSLVVNNLNTDNNGFKLLFKGATSFNQDIASWGWNLPNNLADFLSGSGLDTENYNRFLLYISQTGGDNGILGAEGLEYCNIAARNNLEYAKGWTIVGDNLSAGCVGISGTLLLDSDNNGCDASDIRADGFLINATNGTDTWSTFSNHGNYSIDFFNSDNLTISVLGLPPFYTIDQASKSVDFNNPEDVDFCFTSASVKDLTVKLVPLQDAIPGFQNEYLLVSKNLATETVSNVMVSFTFNDSMQSFVSANPSPTSTSGNEIIFNIGNLDPFETSSIKITMNTFASPAVSAGDMVNIATSILPVTDDYEPNNNAYDYSLEVSNAVNANDKVVLQGSAISIDEIGNDLDYVIRFQNTGNQSAINMKITDILSDKLDVSTFKPVTASHDYKILITNDNIVEFKFNNINLPSEQSNEASSHGFIAFKIKPKNNVAVGDIITGNASVYFDYNDSSAVVTNTVSTEIMAPLKTANFNSLLNNITSYPNPAKDKLNIQLSNELVLEGTTIYDMQGQVVLSNKGNNTEITVENLATGFYILKVTTNLGTIQKQFVKE